MLKYDWYVSIVTRRGKDAYIGIPLTRSPEHFTPHADNGISVLIRHEFEERIRVCFDYPVSQDERRRIVTYMSSVLYPGSEIEAL